MVLTHGYIRKFSDQNNTFIPAEIISICHDFFHTCDIWSVSSKHEVIIIESNGTIAHNTEKSGWVSVFGTEVIGINYGIKQWKIKSRSISVAPSYYPSDRFCIYF